jgi:O-glycosyl hydrolase
LLIPAWLLLAAVPLAAQTRPTELAIDLRDQGRPFRGWGTSLAWWAHGVGDWPEATVDEIVRLVVDPADGVGLSVFRYNIGGGDHPDHHHMRRWGDVPGFKPARDAPYDWDADAAQRRVLLKLVNAAGDDAIVEAFSNSPPWWMTVSGCVAGAADGGPNLKPEFERDFAAYLADVMRFYRDRHDLVFQSLEPFNEPDVDWWRAGKKQEGLHIPRAQQARLIRLTRQALDARGLRQTRVSAADANSIDDALATLLACDADTLAALGQVNTHSYHGGKRKELREAAAHRGKPLWQSESGPLNVRGTQYEQLMTMAQRIVRDINQLRPEVWCTWQFIDGGPWGCLHADVQRKTVRVAKWFAVLATFARGIRPGDRFVHVESDRVVCAVSPARREVTLVLVNRDKAPHTFRLTLRGGCGVPPAASTAAVRTSANEDLVPLAPVQIRNGVLEMLAPAESVTRVTFASGAH